MGYVQIGNQVLVGGEVVAQATEAGEVTALLCDLCNEIVDLNDGFTFSKGSWQCGKCKAVN